MRGSCDGTPYACGDYIRRRSDDPYAGVGVIRQYRYSLNPYSGCRFACAYCYARAFAPTVEKRATWGRWAVAKQNAAELMAKACRDGTLQDGDAVYMSSATDPYQPAEHQVGLTRSILAAILDAGVQPRLTVQTRSPIAARDIDLFRRFENIRVNITVTTDSERVRLRYEPSAPAIVARLRTARALLAAGVPIGLSVSPMLPIEDIEAFAETLASFHADEYVSQYMAPPGPAFAAGTLPATLEMAHHDGWGMRQYAEARQIIQDALGSRRRLLEGVEGFAPASPRQRVAPSPPMHSVGDSGVPFAPIRDRGARPSGGSRHVPGERPARLD